MIKASTKKYEEIQEIINLMKTNQLIALGFMGMARTMLLVKHIANHVDFITAGQFEVFIKGGLKKWLYNNFSINKEVEKGLKICNDLIPALENYDYSDCLNKEDENIMGIAYSLIEEWYYFIGLISENMKDEICKKMGYFLTVPIICIDSYLCSKYDDMGRYDIVQKRVNDDILIKKEIDLINDDLAFVSLNNNLENTKVIEERIFNYMNYNILS